MRPWQICLTHSSGGTNGHNVDRTTAQRRRRTSLGLGCAIGAALCSASAGCNKTPSQPSPTLQITDESVRYKRGTALPATSPIFDGKQVHIAMARGETFGLQVLSQQVVPSSVTLTDATVTVVPFEQTWVTVRRGSTDMYGGGMRGSGDYADGLQPVAQPRSELALFDITVPVEHPAQTLRGQLTVGTQTFPLIIDIIDVTLRLDAPLRVWAYYDERELSWSNTAQLDGGLPDAESPLQARCVAMFRQHGVLAATTLTAAQWPQYRSQFAGAPYVPVRMRSVEDAAQVQQIVQDWIAATKDTGHVPFAIPIDEPRTTEQREAVRRGAELVRQSGGGANRFLFAVTDDPQPSYLDLVDVYFTLWVKRGQFKKVGKPIWTYNGRPPGAGAMVVDAASLSVRTWGVIGFRYNIDLWYIWDAMYWHDRHNRDRGLDGAGDPRRLDNRNRGRAMNAATDAMSFLSKDADVGNLDGVMAFADATTGCAPSLRLKQLRRGLFDRALLQAANCDGTGDRIAAELVPIALGDATRNGNPAWSSDLNVWATARQTLLQAAVACAAASPAVPTAP